MSDPDTPMRVRLLEAAATILADEGPGALSARRVAREVDASTMVVYTHFGSMHDLVRGLAREGFVRLADHLAEVEPSDDPVADIFRLGAAYRRTAVENPRLYGVMFGSASLGGYALGGEDIAEGIDTFVVLVEAARRAMDVGRFDAGDPVNVASQLWSALHGFVMLELAGFFRAGGGRIAASEAVILPLFVNLATGFGDDRDAVDRSIQSALVHLVPQS